jgi:hypothetical protein
MSIYGTGDGKLLWAVGDNGTILHTMDGEPWKPLGRGTYPLSSIYGTGGGKSLWAVEFGGTILHASVAGRHSFIRGARFELGSHGPTLQLEVVCPDNRYTEPLSLQVTARNKYKFETQKPGFRVPIARQPAECGNRNVPIDLSDLEMGSGDVAYFDIEWKAGDDLTVYQFHQRYDAWRWFLDHRKQLAAAAALLGVILTLAVFLRLRPLWNLRIYQFLKLAKIDKLSGLPLVGAPLQVLLKLCTVGLPWFVTHSRTLDAWVRSQSDLMERKWGQETLPARAGDSVQRAIESTSYIPLPLRLADPESGEVISAPSASAIAALFSVERTVIEVIGPGGAGKTMLARQFGRWALRGGRPGGFPGHAMIPVWIDEDLSEKDNPLAGVVRGKLAALLPEEKLDDAFLEALLKKQKLLIVLDRLSERSVATQQYIGRIYRSVRAEALLITARTHVPVQGAALVILYPQPLNQDNLLHFMTSLLSPGANGTKDAVAPDAVSIDDQLALGKKLAALYRTASRADGSQAPILPLPVRLFVEEAKRIIREGRSLDGLPLSVPEVYSRYLEQVNPEEPSLPDFMTHPEMLRAALILAKLALAGDFIPKEFHPHEAAVRLKEAGWADAQKLDPVRRLLNNGILIEKGPLVSRRLRFVLDPIADSLAAVAYLREYGNDPALVDKLRADAARAPGFLAAIDLASRDYPNK